MKKIWIVFLILLMGCIQSTKEPFQLHEDKEVLNLSVEQVEVVPMGFYFDALPHIENQMPVSPEEAIVQWGKNNLTATIENNKKLFIVIQKAEMIKSDKPKQKLFALDEEIYTLSYVIELQLKENNDVIKRLSISGKGFISIPKKTSLSKKEEGWMWLVQKMLDHLKTKLKSEFNEIIL